jgi:bacteriorhodopsin
VFWIATTAVLIRAVRFSYASLTGEGALILRNATVILLGGWFIYPVVYLLGILGTGGEWTTAIQITLTVADILVKLAFSGLIHRIAKLRTAEDVRKGLDVHPEAIWISSVKQSDAGVAREVYLADDAVVHRRREKPPEASAVAASPEDVQLDLDD